VITEWSILTANSGSQAIAVDSTGNIFFTETSAMKIGRFVPSTNIMTEWSVPNLDGGIVSSIFVDASNNVFFNEYAAAQIGRLN
jgi:streptogramin lyase